MASTAHPAHGVAHALADLGTPVERGDEPYVERVPRHAGDIHIAYDRNGELRPAPLLFSAGSAGP